ncbi:DUF484 family protein [Candidatus Symbiobacter mobilis]|uniref:DUF484 family protein n=1 Tax=Candidatus Symbiobacter mobilis CR TaxID=946483 RepID=U5NB31_9BURK|nr:DUF484 family protein [Candidatus Symbiobacter mobilis]AGX88627.1 hypothetical protein Cenrod_2574 [Candidatus Symbiobacter mobilis CR]
MTEAEIAAYLQSSPEFFLRHPQALMPGEADAPGVATAGALRRQGLRIRLLERRVFDLQHASDDRVVAWQDLLHWACAMFGHRDEHSLPQWIVEESKKRLDVAQACVKLWDLRPEFAVCAFAQDVGDNARLLAASLTEPYCGPNTGLEVTQWLHDPHAAASIAVLPLRAGDNEEGPDWKNAPDWKKAASSPSFGLLVLGSADTHRFHGAMDTSLLAGVAALVGAALSRLR